MKIKIFTDGGSRGNPGPAGIGIAIFDSNSQLLMEYGDYIGQATNNVAEYQAVIKGLELGKGLGAVEVQIIADSELMVKQMTGIYKVRNENLIPLYKQVVNLTRQFESVSFQHVKRAFNKDADRLANEAMDARTTIERRANNIGKSVEPKVETKIGHRVKVAAGIEREVIAVGSSMMLVRVYLSKGAVVAKHEHPHEQSSYILQGKVKHIVGNEEYVMEKGESCVIAGGIAHEIVALEDTVELNTFVPIREDFL